MRPLTQDNSQMKFLFLPLCLAALVPANAMADHPESGERVLRHAVFFSFKESSSAEDVQGVVEAFESLPEKIDAIIDFQWGEADPKAKMSAGFSRAFLLTFKDEAGRDVYLPHPEHKAFGDVLRPHMKDVFVIDYWGESKDLGLDSMLKHPVFFRFNENAPAAEITAVEEAFAGLATEINTVKHLEWGKNNSPETHDDGFTHAFMVTFADKDGLKAYGPHPAHQNLVKMLGIVDEVRVIDFVVE